MTRPEGTDLHDVDAYGVAPNMLIELIDEFPHMGACSEIADVDPSIGGEAAGDTERLPHNDAPQRVGDSLGSAHRARPDPTVGGSPVALV